jgi:hypothetical protein
MWKASKIHSMSAGAIPLPESSAESTTPSLAVAAGPHEDERRSHR